MLVDTLGLVLVVKVHSADIQDRVGAMQVLDSLRKSFPRLKVIWADSGYSGQLEDWVHELRQGQGHTRIRLEIVAKIASKGFEVLPKRWIVERTFAWLGRSRRLSKDYEGLCETTEVLIYIAMICLMLRWLTTPNK